MICSGEADQVHQGKHVVYNIDQSQPWSKYRPCCRPAKRLKPDEWLSGMDVQCTASLTVGSKTVGRTVSGKEVESVGIYHFDTIEAEMYIL